MSFADEMIARNAEYVKGYPGPKPLRPSRQVAIVACMDSRLQNFTKTGIDMGEAHIISNAGGVITDEIIRSLNISQSKIGTL